MHAHRCLAALFAVAVATPVLAQQPKPAVVDAAFVPPNFVAALAVNPARLETNATAAGFPAADLLKLVQDQTGVSPKVIDRAVLYVEPFPGGNVLFFPAAAVRFTEGTDAKKQLAAALGETKEATAGGKTYLKSAKLQMAKTEMAGYAVDDRTALFAPWPTLEQMLKGEKGDRPLAAELAKADLDHDLVLVAVPGPVRKELGAAVVDFPAAAKLIAALARQEAATVTADFGKDPVIRAEFRADNAEGATSLHDELKKGLETVKALWQESRKDAEKGLPPGWAKPTLALIDEAANNPKLAKDGKTVTLTVARPKDWPAAPKK